MKNDTNQTAFSPVDFLASAGLGRRIVELKAGENFFSQGDAADSVFYLQKGRAKLTVVSQGGKEATITLLSEGDFVEKNPWQAWLACAWLLPRRSTIARRSRLRAMRWSV